MILEGNERGGAKNLALHLLKDENDHVNVHEVRGFISDDLTPALAEIYAVSRGTKAKKFMFSLSLNPPPNEKVPTKAFEKAINRAEKDLGLTDQPRAIVFHEKNGRRHCHVVWSRINAVEMKAIKIDYYKLKLRDISRDLYIEHSWKMPRGFMNSKERDPTNFTLSQWQQAKRAGKKSKEVKTVFQDCWATSDSLPSFKHALIARGYMLAHGDRGFVVIDDRCEVYSLARQLMKGINKKEVEAKLGKPDGLPSVDEAKTQMAKMIQQRLISLSKQQALVIDIRLQKIEGKRMALIKDQKLERQKLLKAQTEKQIEETQIRQDRYRKGIWGFMDHFTGRHKVIKKKNEQETQNALNRDQNERDALVFRNLEQRQSLTQRVERLELFKQSSLEKSKSDIEQFNEISQGRRDVFDLISDRNRPNRRPSLER